MSSSGFRWESLLRTEATERSLKGALFTTYDRADERLLAEHLLPQLLNLSHEPETEGTEREYFLMELDERLKKLHDRLVVVSSTARDETEEAQNPEAGESRPHQWIWRSIRSLTVGSGGNAVQHSKLWLLHWGASEKENEAEKLEIVVSSANLTRAAFKDQLQAAWRTCVELSPKRSEARLRGWGILPEFLRKLAESAGDNERLTPFVELLARAVCPDGVKFIASVPGTYSHRELRSTPWGVAGLGEIVPPGRGAVSISILSPFVGSWGQDALNRWCTWFKGRSKSLRLVWIDKYHPWAKWWVLPKATLDTMTGAGAKLLRLCHDAGQHDSTKFHEEHRPADDRWSHAKVYLLKRGNARRLLVTSANFSPAAWGREGAKGDLTIENFELGVSVEQGMWPFVDLEIFDDVENAATVAALPNRGNAPIAWAQAAWNGKDVNVKCRCASSETLKGEIRGGDKRIPIDIWISEKGSLLRSARVSWADAEAPPSLVRLVCRHQTMSVVVFDERPPGKREDTLPPGIDKERGQLIRDRLLFEQYGGPIADDDEIRDTDAGGDDDPVPEISATFEEPLEQAATAHDDYSVPAFVAARNHFHVVDNWAEQVKRGSKPGASNFERGILHRDGKFLIGAFERRAARDEAQSPARAIAARLAAEELTLRLEHFPED